MVGLPITVMTYIADNALVSANFKNARVLVVEDSDDYWVLIRQAMTRTMPEVTLIRAATYEQARDLLVGWVAEEWDMPKLILLDLYLPDRHQGWQVLSLIRELETPFNQVPVVMVSGSDLQTDISEAYQRGISSYLIKPILFSGLLDYFQQLRLYWWETVTLPLVRTVL